MTGVELPTNFGDPSEVVPSDAFSVVMAQKLLPDLLHGDWGKVAPSKLSGFGVNRPHFVKVTSPDAGAMALSVNVYVGVLETSVTGGEDIFAATIDDPSVGRRVGL